MPIALDAKSSGTASATNTLTFSHTCSGEYRVLVVSVAAEDDNDTDTDVSGITYNGVAMSRVHTQVRSNGGNHNRITTYLLTAPATGAHDVVITMGGNCIAFIGMSISYTGCRQASQPEAQTTTSAESTTISTSLNTLTDGAMVIDAVCSGSAAGTINPDQGTEQHDIDLTGTVDGGMSDITKTTAGSQTKSWTCSMSSRLALSVISLAPQQTSGFFSLM